MVKSVTVKFVNEPTTNHAQSSSGSKECPSQASIQQITTALWCSEPAMPKSCYAKLKPIEAVARERVSMSAGTFVCASAAA
jgi:hypothetical protein